jgi:8-oxo-dGTP pyrophosphatase MutT (NUDIX family)
MNDQILEFGKKRENAEYRKTVVGILYNPRTKLFGYLDWVKFGWTGFITGGVETGEELIDALKREITEETGFNDYEIIDKLGLQIISRYFAENKNVWREAEMHGFLIILNSGKHKPVESEESENFELKWDSFEIILQKLKTIPKSDKNSFEALIEFLNRAKELIN